MEEARELARAGDNPMQSHNAFNSKSQRMIQKKQKNDNLLSAAKSPKKGDNSMMSNYNFGRLMNQALSPETPKRAAFNTLNPDLL